MKKIVVLGAVAAIMGSSLVHAQGAFNSLPEGSYAQATIGTADLGLDDNAVALTGTYGQGLPQVLPGLGFDVELSATLTGAEEHYDYGYATASGEITYVSLGALATYTYGADQIVKGLDLYVRGGLIYTSYDIEVEATNGTYSSSGSDSGTETDLGLGLGARYKVADQISAVVDVLDHGDITRYSVGAAYAF